MTGIDASASRLRAARWAPASSTPQSKSPSSTRSPSSHAAFAPVFGTDAALVAAKDAATRFAATDLPVLLLAETGTGKELFARAIHAASSRATGPFVALDCGALVSGVLESELFGHAPSSFTGASRHGADGKIAAAHHGTLFLDEIAELPDAVQAALLRVLDHGGAHYRVGDTRPRTSDFRLVCATCRDLPELVERGVFRRDLFFRIHGACVSLPALRDRSDRTALAAELLKSVLPAVPSASTSATTAATTAASAKASTDLSPGACRWIEQHDWPGNVRELNSALVHAVAMADGQTLLEEHFPRVLVGLLLAAQGRDRGRPGRSAHEGGHPRAGDPGSAARLGGQRQRSSAPAGDRAEHGVPGDSHAIKLRRRAPVTVASRTCRNPRSPEERVRSSGSLPR